MRKNEIPGLVFIATKKSRAMFTPLLKGEAEAWSERVEICLQVSFETASPPHPLRAIFSGNQLATFTMTPLALPTKRQSSHTAHRLPQKLCSVAVKCSHKITPHEVAWREVVASYWRLRFWAAERTAEKPAGQFGDRDLKNEQF